jgi:hypothetical protein
MTQIYKLRGAVKKEKSTELFPEALLYVANVRISRSECVGGTTPSSLSIPQLHKPTNYFIKQKPRANSKNNANPQTPTKAKKKKHSHHDNHSQK